MRSQLLGWSLALTVALAATTAGAGSADSVALSRAEGGASYRFHPKQPWKEAGDRIKVGAQVRCGGDCEAALAGGGIVAFAADSEIVVESPRFTKLGEAVARKVDVVRVVAGRATLRAGDAPVLVIAGERELVLREGAVTVVAKGDRLAFGVEADVALREGRQWRDLPRGKVVVLSDQGVEERPIPATPSFRADGAQRPLGLAADGPEGAVTLAWKAMPQASAIRIEVAEDEAFTRIVASEMVPAASGHADVRLREGAYHARIATADRDGFLSPPSASLPVRVMRVALPDGGIIPEPGTIVLPPGTSLRLLSTEGLEMSLGKQGFVPAMREIPLSASKGELRLRVKGAAGSESTFALEPRALRADVSMAPFAPIWPSDSVEVKVALSDPRGHYDPARVSPRFRVFLEEEELFVTWSQKDGFHRAVIHGRRIEGPRLLRVQVDDGVGRTLGTGLVEVVASR